MVYAIMLDNYQHRVDEAHYAVHFSGSLPACRAEQDLPGAYQIWTRANYASRAEVEPHSLGKEPGKIYRLTPAARMHASTGALLAAGAFASGFALSYVLRGPIARAVEQRR